MSPFLSSDLTLHFSLALSAPSLSTEAAAYSKSTTNSSTRWTRNSKYRLKGLIIISNLSLITSVSDSISNFSLLLITYRTGLKTFASSQLSASLMSDQLRVPVTLT